MKKFFLKGVVLTLVLLAVVSTLFLLVYKMNDKEDMGEVPVVVIDGGKDNEVNILDRYDHDRHMGEWPMDSADQIELSDGFVLVTSLISHKGDKIVYYETDGENANVVILDLESKEKVVIEDTLKVGGCVSFEYVPSRWSVNDKKIIREWVHVGDGGCSASVNWAYVLDVDLLTEEVLVDNHNYIILDDNESIVYLTDSGSYFTEMGNIYDGIEMKNIETGEKLKLIEGENEIYDYLKMNEDNEIVYSSIEVIKKEHLGDSYRHEVIGEREEKILELE